MLEALACRPPKAVDRLVRVADDEQTLSIPAPGAYQFILNLAYILELIHKQMGEAALSGGVHLQPFREQVVKIQGAQRPQPIPIGVVEVLVQLCFLQRRAAFHPGHALKQSPRTPLPSGGAEDLFRLGKSLCLTDEADIPQQLPADGVEGADGYAGYCPLPAQPLFQPGAHFGGGLIGEGDSGNLTGFNP